MSGDDDSDARIAEAAREFDAVLHTEAYAHIHADDAQLARLLTHLAPRPGQTVLDLGTGNGYVALAVAASEPACRVTGVDVAARAIAEDVALAKARGLDNARFTAYGGVALPFADDHFDAAASRYAFHHFPDPDTSLAELARVLRAGGRLALADAIRDEADEVDFVNRFQALKRDGHVCMYTRDELTGLVTRHGFRIDEVFESAIAFTRERSAAYDALVQDTPAPVLARYALTVGEDHIRLRFRILNLLLVWGG